MRNIGSHRRRIAIAENQPATRDNFNAKLRNMVNVAYRWAYRRSVGSTEQIKDKQVQAEGNWEWELRSYVGLHEKHEILDLQEDRYYKIKSITPDEFNRFQFVQTATPK